MMLFGDVREVQEVRERPRDRQRFGDRHGRQLEREIVEGSSSATGRPRRLGRAAHLLDALVERGTLLMTERLSQERPQQSDVIAERLVEIVGRGRWLGFDWRMTRRSIGELGHVDSAAGGPLTQQETTRVRDYDDRLTGDQQIRSIFVQEMT
jgi:hypothetical protein